jgi:cobalamin-dependent methionine synthase I
MIGLSGLITPSLDEMVHVASEMQRQTFEVPLLIGGAAKNSDHLEVAHGGEDRYPPCPDHHDKEALFEILQADKLGMSLTESFMMLPAAATSGFYFAHPQSQYFGVGKLQPDQILDWAARKGVSREQAEKWLQPVLAYEPELDSK